MNTVGEMYQLMEGHMCDEAWRNKTEAILGGMAEGHRLAAQGLDEVVAEVNDLWAYIERIPHDLRADYNEFFGTEPHARFGWELLSLALHGEARPYPQDVKDARAARKRKMERPLAERPLSNKVEAVEWNLPPTDKD
tara:strand:- start:114 stop:524 length:411 start_codon:yes stop_codon:yes gene_type:complete